MKCENSDEVNVFGSGSLVKAPPQFLRSSHRKLQVLGIYRSYPISIPWTAFLWLLPMTRIEVFFTAYSGLIL